MKTIKTNKIMPANVEPMTIPAISPPERPSSSESCSAPVPVGVGVGVGVGITLVVVGNTGITVFVYTTQLSIYTYTLYSAKFWRGKTLANLANQTPFANILPCQIPDSLK